MKNLLFGVILIMLVGLASADTISTSISSLGTFKSGTTIELIQVCSNSSSLADAVNISSIKYPNSTIIVSNKAMTKRQGDFNYTLASSKTLALGVYTVSGVCFVGGAVQPWGYSFEVTPNGFNGLLGFYFLALALSYGLVIFGIWKGDPIFTMLGALGLVSMGLFILFNGLDVYKNNLTEAIAIITLGVSFYVIGRTGVEYVNL